MPYGTGTVNEHKVGFWDRCFNRADLDPIIIEIGWKCRNLARERKVTEGGMLPL
jgi:hypothetical protein